MGSELLVGISIVASKIIEVIHLLSSDMPGLNDIIISLNDAAIVLGHSVLMPTTASLLIPVVVRGCIAHISNAISVKILIGRCYLIHPIFF